MLLKRLCNLNILSLSKQRNPFIQMKKYAPFLKEVQRSIANNKIVSNYVLFVRQKLQKQLAFLMKVIQNANLYSNKTTDYPIFKTGFV